MRQLIPTSIRMLAFAFALNLPTVAEDWSHWGGPNANFTIDDAGIFPSDGSYSLRVVWKRKLGTGYSSVSVAHGIAVTMYSDGTLDHVIALDASDGATRWRYTIGLAYLGHWGSQNGPLSTPLITEQSVIALGPHGNLVALDIETGFEIWSVDLLKTQDGRSPFWGFTSSPRLIGNLLILQSGGAEGKAISAYNPDTGELIWSTGTDEVDYQSHGIFAIGNRMHLVFHGNQKLIGIQPENGEELWSFAHGGGTSASSTSSHPVEIAEGRYFVKNSGSGGVLIQVTEKAGAFTVKEIWRTRNIGGTYIYPIYHKGLLFGYKGRILTALDVETGDRVWRSREPGDGLPLIVDDHLVIITKEGRLSIAPADDEGYRETASLQVFDDIVWSPACFTNGKFYARSMSEIACVEVVSKRADDATVADLKGQIPNTQFSAFIGGLSSADDKQALVDHYLLTNKTFPIIEETDLVHFIYTGEAEEVTITGDHIGRRMDHPMHHVEGTNLFYYSSRLEPDARITYRFTIDLQQPAVDARNPNRIRSLFFGEASWFGMPHWKFPSHLIEHADGIHGRLDTLSYLSESMGRKLPIAAYLPPDYSPYTKPYPVTYLHDMRLPFTTGKLSLSLDNLVRKSTVRPFIIVHVPSLAGGGYNAYVGKDRDRYREIFVNEVIPFIDRTYNTIKTRDGRANYGTGRGGFMAFYASTQHPELFSAIAIQSTYWDQTSESEKDTIIKPASSLAPFRLYLDWGRYDARSPLEGSDTGKATERFAKALMEKGYRYVGGRVNDGAGWASWRNRTDKVFESLFPYEP